MGTKLTFLNQDFAFGVSWLVSLWAYTVELVYDTIMDRSRYTMVGCLIIVEAKTKEMKQSKTLSFAYCLLRATTRH